jgi:hypothetical protein
VRSRLPSSTRIASAFAVEGLHHLREAAYQLGDDGFLVVRGDYEGVRRSEASA